LVKTKNFQWFLFSCVCPLEESSRSEEEIVKEIREIVREIVGPVAAFRLAARVPALPRTRSGKTPRKTIADLARAKKVIIPGTIEDPGVYTEIKAALQRLGYAVNAPDPE
jgi:propionyl-CoA synthetase